MRREAHREHLSLPLAIRQSGRHTTQDSFARIRGFPTQISIFPMKRRLLIVAVLTCAGCEPMETTPPPNTRATAAAPVEKSEASSGSAFAAEASSATSTSYADVPTALKALAEAIPADDQETMRSATLWLSKQGQATVEPARVEVENPGNDVRYRLACLNVLGFVGPPAESVILKATESETPQVRLKAVDALGGIHPSSTPIVDRLIALLDDPDEAVKRRAIESLGRIGQPAQRAAPKLQAILNSDANDSLRGAAKAALVKVEPRRGFHKP